MRKLPLTIEPWVSKEAIDPGTRWGKELAEALEGTSFGILCLTSENQREPWISFEAGALSKTIEKTYVVPYLIGMTPAELEQPLKQFQASEANEEGTWKLVETMYIASGDKTRSTNDLNESFKMWWPKLSEQIENAKNDVATTLLASPEPSISDIKLSIDKVLTIIESLSNRITKWESERSSLGTSFIKTSLRQRGIREDINSLKDDLSLRDLAVIDSEYQLQKFKEELMRVLKEKTEQESIDKSK